MQIPPPKTEEREQVELILHSETFRTSEVLRHLLSFLADKTFSGEADQLKEYTVAIDALQKPSTYNPKHDSTVRIQVSRLRQKLGEYYRGEGKNDAVVIDIPKGRFKLLFDTRLEPELPSLPPALVEAPPKPKPRLFGIAVAMGVCLLLALIWAGYETFRLHHIEAAAAETTSDRPVWTPEIQTIWSPFISNSRPLIIGIEDPLFMELQVGDGIYYRDRAVDDWNKMTQNSAVINLRKLFSNPKAQPSHYYTTLGEASATFLIGGLLSTRQENVSLVRSSQLSWQELVDNNILFVGKQSFFDEQIQGMPSHPPFVTDGKGIENSNPLPGEPKLLEDRYSGAPTEDGEVYALVTHLPGPGGKGVFSSFISNRAAGYVGALQWFTDPQTARVLVNKLTNSKGEFPKYYQVVLKVKFKDEVPTETSYVLSRAIN